MAGTRCWQTRTSAELATPSSLCLAQLGASSSPDSIGDSDASAASSGCQLELTYWTECISSNWQPLDAADASESPIKSKGKISQNFVAFSEYMNFTGAYFLATCGVINDAPVSLHIRKDCMLFRDKHILSWLYVLKQERSGRATYFRVHSMTMWTKCRWSKISIFGTFRDKNLHIEVWGGQKRVKLCPGND